MKLLFIFLILSTSSYAQLVPILPPYPTEGSSVVPEKVKEEESPIEETIQNAQTVPAKEIETKKQKVKEKKTENKTKAPKKEDTLSHSTFMFGYEFVTSWVPSKKTLSYTYNFNEKWTLEGEYAWASISAPSYGINLGEIEEKRFSLHARRYTSSSFHFIFGAVLNDLKAELGDDILDAFGAELTSGIRLQNLGLSLGMGNRWHWKNGITAGIDWMRVNVPLLETKLEDEVLDDVGTSSDKKDVKEALKTFNRIPTFVLFGLNLGYSF